MALIPFPNIPQLPGVPQLRRSPRFPASPPLAVNGAVAIGRLALSFLSKPVWGVFQQNPPNSTSPDGVGVVTVVDTVKPVIVPDSIRDFSFRQEYDVSDYPVEQGSFVSYNKVLKPFEASVRMTKSGAGLSNLFTSNPLGSKSPTDILTSGGAGGGGSGQSARSKFLQQLDAIAGTTNLYQIRTPERTYFDCNILYYEVVRRGEEGAFFLTEVDVFFRQIKSTTAQYTTTAVTTINAKNPSATPTVNGGAVRAVPAT